MMLTQLGQREIFIEKIFVSEKNLKSLQNENLANERVNAASNGNDNSKEKLMKKNYLNCENNDLKRKVDIDERNKKINSNEKFFKEKFLDNTRYVFVDSNEYGIFKRNVFAFAFLHIAYAYTLYRLFSARLYYLWIFGFWYAFISGVGVTCGAHRLWSHKSYKAKLPLRIFLMIAHTMAGQNDLYTWCRDHRLHHKFSETDADPHNSNRGFFFTHVGWLLTKKHPDVILKGKTVDCSDLLADPVVKFQKKYYVWMYTFFCFLLPTILCRYLIGNSWSDSFMVGCFGRYIVSLHVTWFVNSAAHMFGDRPFSEKIAPRENKYVSFAAWGSEGFHNFHHVFPWDYAISELGWSFNPMKDFIDFMAYIGQAYDLKQASPELIARTKKNVDMRLKNPDNDGNFIDAYAQPHSFC